jgi:hypothetical protein
VFWPLIVVAYCILSTDLRLFVGFVYIYH